MGKRAVRPRRTPRPRHRFHGRARLGDRGRPRGRRCPRRRQRTRCGARRRRRGAIARLGCRGPCSGLRRGRWRCGARCRGPNRARSRPPRHPGQQCRHQPAAAVRCRVGGRLAHAAVDEPRRPVPALPRRAARHAAARPRRHHQHLLARERSRTPGHRPVCDEQGSVADADARACRGARSARDPRQRHRTRILRDGHECGPERTILRSMRGCGSARRPDDGARCPRSPARRCSSHPTQRAM